MLARRIASQGVSWPNIRRYGRQLCPQEAAWNQLDRRTEVSPEAALAILLVHHLVEKNVLQDHEALSAVAFFMEGITRYAKDLFSIVDDLQRLGGKTANIQVPVVMLEIVEGRWARLGQGSCALFDIEEQCEADFRQEMESRPMWAALWSHSVCLLPLFLKVCPVDDDDHGDAHDGPEDAGEQTLG